MGLRRLAIIGGVSLGVLFCTLILLNSSGYKLQPTELRQLHAVSAQVENGKTQITKSEQRISEINNAIAGLQKHLQDDITTYHKILSKAGQ